MTYVDLATIKRIYAAGSGREIKKLYTPEGILFWSALYNWYRSVPHYPIAMSLSESEDKVTVLCMKGTSSNDRTQAIRSYQLEEGKLSNEVVIPSTIASTWSNPYSGDHMNYLSRGAILLDVDGYYYYSYALYKLGFDGTLLLNKGHQGQTGAGRMNSMLYLDNDTIVGFWSTGYIYLIDKTGKEIRQLWSNSNGGEYFLGKKIYNGYVYVCQYGGLYKLDPEKPFNDKTSRETVHTIEVKPSGQVRIDNYMSDFCIVGKYLYLLWYKSGQMLLTKMTLSEKTVVWERILGTNKTIGSMDSKNHRLYIQAQSKFMVIDGMANTIDFEMTYREVSELMPIANNVNYSGVAMSMYSQPFVIGKEFVYLYNEMDSLLYRMEIGDEGDFEFIE